MDRLKHDEPKNLLKTKSNIFFLEKYRWHFKCHLYCVDTEPLNSQLNILCLVVVHPGSHFDPYNKTWNSIL